MVWALLGSPFVELLAAPPLGDDRAAVDAGAEHYVVPEGGFIPIEHLECPILIHRSGVQWQWLRHVSHVDLAVVGTAGDYAGCRKRARPDGPVACKLEPHRRSSFIEGGRVYCFKILSPNRGKREDHLRSPATPSRLLFLGLLFL